MPRITSIRFCKSSQKQKEIHCQITVPVFQCPKHGRQLLLDGAQEIAKELFDHIGSIVCVRSAMASGKTTMLPVKLVEYSREQRQTVKVVMLMPYVFLLIVPGVLQPAAVRTSPG